MSTLDSLRNSSSESTKSKRCVSRAEGNGSRAEGDGSLAVNGEESLDEMRLSSGLVGMRTTEGECGSGSAPPVSEHEEEEGHEEEEFEEGFGFKEGGIVELSLGVSPMKIPCEEREEEGLEEEREEEEAEEESDYEYDYSDEEDCHLSFLSPVSAAAARKCAVACAVARTTTEIPRDEETSRSSVPLPPASSQNKRSSWKEPSREAVSMSLRAERETTGGKRRLASDLYKIMMGDTAEQGFSLEPSSEDSLEKWKIKLFNFDKDSNLQKDLVALGLDHVELEMSFPDQYPFEAPFVRVVRPRFQKQTGFVMNGALCMELLTNEGWNPVNDIESVIVSIRSLIVVGGGRLAAAAHLHSTKQTDSAPDHNQKQSAHNKRPSANQDTSQKDPKKPKTLDVGKYSASEARAAYSHLSAYHAKKGWDSNGWWAKMG